MNKVLSIEDVSYKMGNKAILKNINLTVYPEDSFALIGKNGAGKTTLFEIILKDLKPTSGHVLFNNTIGNDFKNMGVVYDHLPLFPLLKVKEIINYFSSIYGIKPNKIPTQYYDVFGLDNILNSYIKTLSQGERKKVGLFLSIIHNPKLLILDEPFSNVDPTVIDGIWQLLKSENRTILFTTHNWKNVEELATKIAFIHDGIIIMEPTSVEKVLESLPYSKKIIIGYNDNIIKNIEHFDYYINDNLVHIFTDKSDVIDMISTHTNNFSFKECDIKDAYLFKIKNYEKYNHTL